MTMNWDEEQRVVPEPPPACVILSDPGQDLDDEVALLLMGALHTRGELQLLGVVCTLAPAADRARLARGLLDALGLSSVLVGVGSDGNAAGPGQLFLQHPRISPDPVDLTGEDVFLRIYNEAADSSIVFFILASYSAAANFAKGHTQLFAAKTKSVVIMGGAAPVLIDDAGDVIIDEAADDAPAGTKRLIPDDAHNNTMDRQASREFMDLCQDHCIPMVLVTRHAATACSLHRDFYDELADTGSPIGEHMQKAQESAIQELWERAEASSESGGRKGLPERCDGKWFRKTFCGGQDPLQAVQNRGSCWQAVKSLNLYDPVAVLAGLPGPQDLFDFTEHVVNGTSHRIAGVSAEDPGVDYPAQVEALVRNLALEGLEVTLKLLGDDQEDSTTQAVSQQASATATPSDKQPAESSRSESGDVMAATSSPDTTQLSDGHARYVNAEAASSATASERLVASKLQEPLISPSPGVSEDATADKDVRTAEPQITQNIMRYVCYCFCPKKFQREDTGRMAIEQTGKSEHQNIEMMKLKQDDALAGGVIRFENEKDDINLQNGAWH